MMKNISLLVSEAVKRNVKLSAAGCVLFAFNELGRYAFAPFTHLGGISLPSFRSSFAFIFSWVVLSYCMWMCAERCFLD
jgi:hypothetical protein